MNQQNLKDLSLRCLEWALKAGATSAEVGVGINDGFEVTARLAEAENVVYQRSKELSLTVYVGQRAGSVSTSDFDASKMEDLVKRAVAIANLAQEDPAGGIPERELLQNPIPSCAIDFPWAITPEAAMQKAVEGDKAGLALDKRIKNSEGTTISTYRGHTLAANTNGFFGEYHETYHSLSSSFVAETKGNMQRDYYYHVARDANDLPAIESIAHEAVRRAVARLSPKSIKTQEISVLMCPEIARSLLGHFVGAIQGSALYRRSSFLLDKLGEPIFPEFFTLSEAPHLAKGISTAPFDSDGVVTYAKDFIVNGVLTSYAYDCYSARKLNAKSTANSGGLANVIIKPGTQNFYELIKSLDKGLLVTEVMGQGVNLVTGDYSRGAAGFWVENGEIQYPVDGVTLAGNLKNLFANIRALGNDVDVRGNIQAPSLIIDGVMLAGK